MIGLAKALAEPDDAASDPLAAEDSDDAVKDSAAEDMIAALKSGDKAGLKDAFQRMYDACAMAPAMDDEYSE